MFDFYMSFMGRWGMLIYLAIGAVEVLYFVFAQIRHNRRRERDRIAREFWGAGEREMERLRKLGL